MKNETAGGFDVALGMLTQINRDAPGAVFSLTEAERVERANFALEHSVGVPRSDALQAIVTSWLEGGRYGLPELRNWLLGQANATDSANAFAMGARMLAAQDFSMPESLQWALQLADPRRRDPLLRGIYLRWQDASPQQAERFLESAPPETRIILQGLPIP